MEPFIKIEIKPVNNRPYYLAEVLKAFISAYNRNQDTRKNGSGVLFPSLIKGESSGFIKLTTNCVLVPGRSEPYFWWVFALNRCARYYLDRIFGIHRKL